MATAVKPPGETVTVVTPLVKAPWSCGTFSRQSLMRAPGVSCALSARTVTAAVTSVVVWLEKAR